MDSLLVLSQVVLSLQLSFAVVPLVTFTSDRKRMGEFASAWWVRVLALVTTAIIVGLNGKLAYDVIGGWVAASPGAWWVWGVLLPLVGGLVVLLAFLIATPFMRRGEPATEPATAMAGAPISAAAEAGAAMAAMAAEREAALVAAHEPEPLRWNSGNYRRIAVAVELATADENIVHFLRQARIAPEAELVFVHVAESAASRWLGEESLDQESRDDQVALERLAREFAEAGVRTSVRLGHGDATREIARIVQEERADLLVTGSHGHKGLSDVVFGATVSGVRHLVSCPILTVPPLRRH